jgi:mRNA interferase RelE/StbE
METVKYIIRYQEEVIRKHIPELPAYMQKSIKNAIEERLVVDPVGFGKPLQYSLNGHRRLRVGSYRICIPHRQIKFNSCDYCYKT